MLCGNQQHQKGWWYFSYPLHTPPWQTLSMRLALKARGLGAKRISGRFLYPRSIQYIVYIVCISVQQPQLYFDAVIIANVVVVVVAFSPTCCLFFNITQGQHLVSIKTLQLVVTKRAQKNISSRINLINNREKNQEM